MKIAVIKLPSRIDSRSQYDPDVFPILSQIKIPIPELPSSRLTGTFANFTKYFQNWLIIPPFPVHRKMAHLGGLKMLTINHLEIYCYWPTYQTMQAWSPFLVSIISDCFYTSMRIKWCEHRKREQCVKKQWFWRESEWKTLDFRVNLESVKTHDFFMQLAAHPLIAV